MKKFLSVLLCIVLLLNFVGCVNQDSIKFTKKDLEKVLAQEFVKPKNVIVLIGDGMGLNDIALTNKFSKDLFKFGLLFENLSNVGQVTTNSLSGVTDSAASATAMATGQKTVNGYVGLDRNANTLKNAVEVAREEGKKVGIVTNDKIFGATPVAFSIHHNSREDTEKLLELLMECAPDVLMGDGYSEFRTTVYEEVSPKFNIASSQKHWQTRIENDAKGQKPFLGFMDVNHNEINNLLAQATELAINRLENEKGFFLMVECATPDKAGHSNNIEQKIVGVANLDKAVAIAVKYCMENPDTLLIVTSDHETGGVVLPETKYKLTNELFTSVNHTGADVGIFALGYGTEYFKDKKVDNTDIGKFIHAALKGETYK